MSENLECGICLGSFKDPIILRCCGLSACRDCLLLLPQPRICPFDRKALDQPSNWISNRSLLLHLETLNNSINTNKRKKQSFQMSLQENININYFPDEGKISLIRKLAASNGWKENDFNPSLKVISFSNASNLKMLNVYYSTMNIGLVLRDPGLGSTLLFRTETSTVELHKIFFDSEIENNSLSLSKRKKIEACAEKEFLAKHIKYLSSDLILANIRIKEIEDIERIEAERIKRHLELEAQRKKAEENRLKEIEEEEKKQEKLRKIRIERGENVYWSLQHHEHIPSKLDTFRSIAIGEGGYIAVADNGTCAYHGIPYNVAEQVKRAQNKNIELVAIGPRRNGYGEHQFYILKTNGKQFGNASDQFWEAINSKPQRPVLVCFDENDSYFIKFSNRSCNWSGNINESAQKVFQRADDIICVWLGENGSYFIGYEENGEYKKSYYRLPREISSYACNRSCEIRQLFYEHKNDTYFISCN